MTRSSTKFWSLLAITVAADIFVTFFLLQREMFAGSFSLAWQFAPHLWSALTRGQLSVLVIWSVLRRRLDVWSWIVPVGGLFVVAALREHLHFWGRDWRVVDHASRAALQMLLLAILLWLMIRAPLWYRLTGDMSKRKWEFSLRQLLVWMTAVAILSVVIADGARLPSGLPIALAAAHGIAIPALLASAIVFASQLKWPGILRWSFYLAAGLAAGACIVWINANIERLGFNPANGPPVGVTWQFAKTIAYEFATEAIVVAAWVEWGSIIPISPASSADIS